MPKMPLAPALQACPPRPELGDAQEYAANLDKALADEIASESGAADFFAATYPTRAMQDACRMAFDRLKNGAAGGQPGVYRFSSVYGGGKTHTLIALAAAARHPNLIRSAAAQDLVPPDLAVDGVRIVSFNGRNSDTLRGVDLDDSGVRAKSIAGFIAYRLGGADALAEIREHDDRLADPGAAWYARLFSDKPTLILVDELIHHVARAIQQGARDVSAANVHLAIAALAHAIDASPRTVLVTTTPEQGHDAFRTDARVQEIMDRIASELARVSHEMTPSASEDLAAILRQRLFLSWDEDARAETSRAYAEIAKRLDPADADAENRFAAAYPFHPDLIDLIQNWLFANGDFQRVRGAIRMMANIVSGGKLGDAALIHPHHADVSIRRLHDHLIAGLRHEGIAPAITTDVIGERSTAGRIGTELARRIAGVILLASLAPKSVNGIDEARTVSAVLAPDNPDPAVARAAFAEYSGRALFLDETPGRRGERFTSQPNVRRMVNEYISRFEVNQIEDALRDAVRAEYDQSAPGKVENPLPVVMYPSRANGAPDLRDAVHLCVIAPANFNWRDREGNENIIAELHREKSGAAGANREHRNNLIFLVAQDDDLADVRSHLVTHMAARAVKKEQSNRLQTYQTEILDEIIARERKAVSQSIQSKWTHLIYPAGRNDLGDAAPHLAHEALTAATDSEGSGQAPVIAKLIERHKIPNPERPRLSPRFWAGSPLGVAEFEREGRTVAEVHRMFTASPSRVMMLNRDAFRNVIIEAARAQDLYIESPTGQAITADNVGVGIEDDFRVWIRGKEPRCLNCNERANDGEPCAKCAKQPPDPPPDPDFCPKCGERVDGERCPKCESSGPPTPDAPIPDFTSDLVKASLAAAALGNHMATHRARRHDVATLEIMSTVPDDLTYIAIKMGASLAAKAAFQIEVHALDGSLTFELRDQTAEQWQEREATVNRIIGYPQEDPVVDCRMAFARPNCAPDDFAAIVNSFDNRRDIVLRATFNRQPTSD